MNFTDELIAQSLSHISQSSDANVKNFNILKNAQKTSAVPQKYNKDKLVLLPINPNNSFVYWEITDKTVEKFGADTKNIELSFKLFDEKHHEIIEFNSHFAIGSHYINHKSSHKAIYIKLFLKIGNRVEYILSSNIMGVLDNTLKSKKSSQLIDECLSTDLIYSSSLLGVK